MERRKYRELTEFLEGNVLEQWDKQKMKQLEKESSNFKVKHGTLYRKTNEKMLRVLKENEIDTVLNVYDAQSSNRRTFWEKCNI